jgi:hypothetical protein
VSRRKKASFKDGIYKVAVDGGAPAEVVMTVAIEMFLREIGLSTDRLEALGYDQGEIQVEVLRILLARTEEAYGLTSEAETQ